jgi:hypothetical protein
VRRRLARRQHDLHVAALARDPLRELHAVQAARHLHIGEDRADPSVLAQQHDRRVGGFRLEHGVAAVFEILDGHGARERVVFDDKDLGSGHTGPTAPAAVPLPLLCGLNAISALRLTLVGDGDGSGVVGLVIAQEHATHAGQVNREGRAADQEGAACVVRRSRLAQISGCGDVAHVVSSFDVKG